MKKPKLAPELVPKPLWGMSAYRLLKRSAWNAIRKDALAEHKNKCSLCNADGLRLTCHEEWKYDELKRTATLAGFEIVCGPCSSVLHFGQSSAAGYRAAALQQMCRVNGINEADAEKAIRAAFHIWERRNKLSPWKVQIQPVLLKRYPALANLAAA